MAHVDRAASNPCLAAEYGKQASGRCQLNERGCRLEDQTEKSIVTPGPLAPTRELYGAMLLERGMAKEALSAFEATLKKEPNRLGATSARRRPPKGRVMPPRHGNTMPKSSRSPRRPTRAGPRSRPRGRSWRRNRHMDERGDQ